MIPQSALPDESRLKNRPQPGRTYKLDLNRKRIAGTVDGLDAVTQAVRKILLTERYAWLIYNWDYGMELEQYLGQHYDFVVADLERAVTEALVMDDRVLGIQDFHIRKRAVDAMEVEFTVLCSEGDVPIEMEVPI